MDLFSAPTPTDADVFVFVQSLGLLSELIGTFSSIGDYDCN